MMGKEKQMSPKLFYNFRLEKRIPANHPLRSLKALLELDFMYDVLADKYGSNGNVSVPPPILMKMMLLLVLYNVISERELMRTIPYRLDWLWFLGYDIDDEVPDHSVLSKARKRWGEDVFRELFERVLLHAMNSGLVNGKKLFVDASLVEADASKNSVKRVRNLQVLDLDLESTYKEFIRRLDEEEEEVVEVEVEVEEEEKVEKKISSSNGNNGNIKVLENKIRYPRGKSYKAVNEEHRSSTDGDATLVAGKGMTKLYYKVHRGVDELFEIITSCKTTTGKVNEAHELEDLIECHEELLAKKLEIAVGDSKYGTRENFINLKKRGIRTHLKDLSEAQKEGGLRGDKFSRDAFEYNKEEDFFVCPAGEKLVRRSFNIKRNWIEYKADGQRCRECQLRSQCTRAKDGRTVKRYIDEKYLEQGKLDSHSIRGKGDLRKRKHLMERSFATGTRFGYKRARWRGLWRVSIQQYLICIVQNLLKIMKYGGNVKQSNGGVVTIPQKISKFGFTFIFRRFFKRLFCCYNVELVLIYA